MYTVEQAAQIVAQRRNRWAVVGMAPGGRVRVDYAASARQAVWARTAFQDDGYAVVMYPPAEPDGGAR